MIELQHHQKRRELPSPLLETTAPHRPDLTILFQGQTGPDHPSPGLVQWAQRPSVRMGHQKYHWMYGSCLPRLCFVSSESKIDRRTIMLLWQIFMEQEQLLFDVIAQPDCTAHSLRLAVHVFK